MADGSTVSYTLAEGRRSWPDVEPFDLSPDGSLIVAGRSEQDATGITRTTELVVVDPTSGVDRAIARADPGETFGPARWSPEGSRIAYSVTTLADPSGKLPIEEGATHLCVSDAPSSHRRCFDVSGGVYSFDWAPDGTRLLVAGAGEMPVVSVDVRKGTTEVVVPPGGDDGLRAELDRLGYGEATQFILPQWSPSGRYIASLVSLRGGSRAYVPAILTPEGRFVSLAKASGEFPDAFAWAPDRDLLAYTAGEAPYAIKELYVHDLGGETDRHIATTQDDRGTIPRIDGLAWSPDGRWVAFSNSSEALVVDARGEEPPRRLDVSGTIVDWGPDGDGRGDPHPEPTSSPQWEGSDTDPSEYIGFRPASRLEDGQVVMPLTFVDGSTGEAVGSPDLGLQHMTAAIYTAGGLERVDRTMSFRYGEPAALAHAGPLETYQGHDGRPVEVWEGTPGDWECPNLVFRFGDWFVGVRTCQRELSVPDKELWARSLRGRQTPDGFLVLSAERPLVLQKTGGHDGPQLVLGMDRADWIELTPGRCDPAKLPDEGDIRTMKDGTRVSFSQIGDGSSGIEYDWFATWCEDGLVQVQVSHAYERFAVAAAEGFRMRDVILAQ